MFTIPNYFCQDITLRFLLLTSTNPKENKNRLKMHNDYTQIVQF